MRRARQDCERAGIPLRSTPEASRDRASMPAGMVILLVSASRNSSETPSARKYGRRFTIASPFSSYNQYSGSGRVWVSAVKILEGSIPTIADEANLLVNESRRGSDYHFPCSDVSFVRRQFSEPQRVCFVCGFIGYGYGKRSRTCLFQSDRIRIQR